MRDIQGGDDTVLVIKAPAGTILEVPDQETSGAARYQFFVTSSGGPMKVCVIENDDAGEGPLFEIGDGLGKVSKLFISIYW